MSKQFWAVIVAIAVILGGVFWFTGNNNKSNGGSSSNVSATKHIEGNGSTGVTLVEYGDYECPFCAEWYPVVKQVQSDYSSQIYYQFRNFPLQSIHKNAFAASRAAEAAGLEGKFWEMHDQLYVNNDYQGQSGWVSSNDPLTYFDQFAKNIGLNVTKFNTDYSSDKVNALVNADLTEGNKLGINSTPTFYLDGKLIQPKAITVDALKTFIDAEIAKKTGNKPSTTTPSTTNSPSSSSSKQ
ncbi:MAG TPA: thioredoxin domain-containing protein [Candidatus Saccharimonadales bacterium]|nr:thioredoxin domain-containing protein [Candidatus Saccharimonadales bacterium]